jgi:hypothetical protein
MMRATTTMMMMIIIRVGNHKGMKLPSILINGPQDRFGGGGSSKLVINTYLVSVISVISGIFHPVRKYIG